MNSTTPRTNWSLRTYRASDGRTINVEKVNSKRFVAHVDGKPVGDPARAESIGGSLARALEPFGIGPRVKPLDQVSAS